MMTIDERRKVLESFGRSPALLSAALRDFPRRMWLYKPSADRWSIHEIILHLADSEVSAYMTARQFIAQPGIAPVEFDENRWAESLGYFHQSTREALEIIRRLRRMTYRLLITLSDPVWHHKLVNSKFGEIQLEKWVEHQEQHIPHHLVQMRENYEHYIRLNPPRKPASSSTGSLSLSQC